MWSGFVVENVADIKCGGVVVVVGLFECREECGRGSGLSV